MKKKNRQAPRQPATHSLLVAGKANPRQARLTKAERRLAARVADFTKTVEGKDGYKKPGSLKK